MAEYVLLSEQSLSTLSVRDLDDPIDFVESTRSQINLFPSLLSNTDTWVTGYEDSTAPLQEIYYWTSRQHPNNIIDFITKTNLQIIDWPKFISAEETYAVIDSDSVLEGNRTIFTTDFVSITSFNLPKIEPLAFPERWAG